VRSDTSWQLIDAGWEGDAERIRVAAEHLFGIGFHPAGILLTHDHPDHSGAARELAQRWKCRVFVHPDELAIARGSFSAMWQHAGPLDRYVILPAISALGRSRRDAMLARSSLREVVESLPPDGKVPHLPDWRWVHTPGHTPGHASYHRPDDGVLITGDALVTLRVNTLGGMLQGRQGLSEPPRYTTPDPGAARRSIRTLAGLRPRVVAGGHGHPLGTSDTPDRVAAFADSLVEIDSP
jgi:glyoxylase-like metal-dependent hydrolase (beta-lactamase superfamily II)